MLIPFPDGTFLIMIAPLHRQVIADVCGELRTALETGTEEPSFRRLFPTAYAEDADRQQFFEQMTHGDLTDARTTALGVVIDTAQHESLTVDELNAWMIAVNAVRLVVGTRLDIDQGFDPDDIDEDDPEAVGYAVYELFTMLLGAIVRCLQPRP